MKLLASVLAASAVATAWMLLPGTSELSVPTASSAAVDYFLKIDGIDGESTDDRGQGSIEIQSFSWGLSQMGTGGHGGGGGAGKVQFQDFHFTTDMSKASPMLMLGTATGQHYKNAILIGMKPQSNEKFFEIKLEDVLISSYQDGGTQGSVPTDQFSLNFSKIEFSYWPQSPDGSLGAPVKAGYDVKANKKI